jgi:hypothetical protein
MEALFGNAVIISNISDPENTLPTRKRFIHVPIPPCEKSRAMAAFHGLFCNLREVRDGTIYLPDSALQMIEPRRRFSRPYGTAPRELLLSLVHGDMGRGVGVYRRPP